MQRIRRIIALVICLPLFFSSGCLPNSPQPTASVKSGPLAPPSPLVEPKKSPLVEQEKITLLLSDNSEIYRAQTAAIKAKVATVNILVLSEIEREGLGAKLVGDKGPLIALGVEAAQASLPYVKSRLVVFSLVFNYWDAKLLERGMVGVGMLPKQEQVLRRAHELLPRVKKVALPVGPGMSEYADAAKQTAEKLGLDLNVAEVRSDKELLLYAARLDDSVGLFWLLPDNRILSGNAIRQLLANNLKKGRSNIVFTSELFKFGGLVSASYSVSAIAETIVSVIKSTPAKRQKLKGVILQPDGATLNVNQALVDKLDLGVPAAQK